MGVIAKNGYIYSGPPGNGITRITHNADSTLTFILSDGTTYTTDPIVGDDGVGIDTITFNDNSTITITLTNGDEVVSDPLNFLPPVSSDDIGKTLVVNENGLWDTEDVTFETWTKYSASAEPDQSEPNVVVIADRLPNVTDTDAGKFLRVNSEGQWAPAFMWVADTTEF